MATPHGTQLTPQLREEIARHAEAEAAKAPLATEAQQAALYQALWAPVSINVVTPTANVNGCGHR